ncbi:non-hydrolyzing UDP-N-acetylglucosamine 2-epimerase [Algoriphagus sp.]|nr:UDP-N-acetylglucosamine 2-epimerase (non-hydrolyzing) [Algoriphagus sp.]MDP3201774.1 UDP-N-acetylglucosamine 2-epimerase (non-hydrolyzing) [Algoriphagus sp.]
MKRILTIIGARPQFVKAAVLSRLIQTNIWNKKFEEILVHTGQHYDKNMSDIFFDEMKIPKPAFNLEVGSGNHGKMTGEMLIKIERLLFKVQPDYLLVYGDTNSTLAGALAASKLHIPVIHIEAGLRSYNMLMPEEQNRVLTDRISSFLFAPTQDAIDKLKNEGLTRGVYMVGDIMFDAALFYKEIISENILGFLKGKFYFDKFALATIHRAENTDNKFRLSQIIEGLGLIPLPIILPLHPRTKKQLDLFGISVPQNIIVIEPLGYLSMLELEKNSECIFTDSGGVQKEAYFFGIPCFTLRDETEWIETIEKGWNILVGASRDNLLNAFLNFNKPSNLPPLFGDGNSGSKILEILHNQ